MGTDECIERAARVSYGYGTRKRSQTRGLLRYLRRHKHTTPSEMVELKFHCCMPMFIARQWIRHRTANVNEYSGRYSLMPMLFYTPGRGAAADAEPAQQPGTQRRGGRAGAARRGGAALERDPPREHRRLRVDDQQRDRARAGAHRSAAVDVYAVVLEDRPAQPAALSHAAGRRSRAVGDPGVRSGDGGDAQARGAAVVRGVDRLRRVRRAPRARRARSGAHAGERRRRRIERGGWDPSIARRWRRAGCRIARSTSCSRSCGQRRSPDFELDLAQAKSGEEFARRFEAAVPSQDRNDDRKGDRPRGGTGGD